MNHSDYFDETRSAVMLGYVLVILMAVVAACVAGGLTWIWTR
jgi:hypothetical protein